MTDLAPLPAKQIAHAMARDLMRRGRTSQLVVHETNFARAYVYSGDWVADCPNQCGNVEFVCDKPAKLRGATMCWGDRKDTFVCSYCGFMTNSIRWPADAEQIQAVLDRRPIPHTRNWYPAGHATAVKLGIPDGQAVAELEAENDEHGVG